MMKKLFFALLSGLLFSAGLVLSGMTQPAKVIGFLNIGGLSQGVSWTAAAGFWDPSLAFVMGGALMVTLLGFAVTPRLTHTGGKPWAAERFDRRGCFVWYWLGFGGLLPRACFSFVVFRMGCCFVQRGDVTGHVGSPAVEHSVTISRSWKFASFVIF
jgi:uncharacterized membrane protein YedE/YeeE